MREHWRDLCPPRNEGAKGVTSALNGFWSRFSETVLGAGFRRDSRLREAVGVDRGQRKLSPRSPLVQGAAELSALNTLPFVTQRSRRQGGAMSAGCWDSSRSVGQFGFRGRRAALVCRVFWSRVLSGLNSGPILRTKMQTGLIQLMFLLLEEFG